MANKPIQSIQYPGLPDTYTFTQLTTNLTEAGKAADAKAVGDKFDNNEANITDLLTNEYKAYATDEATGAVASFPDGADDIPMKDVTVQIEPVQDLHGYDSPWPAGGGTNLFNYDAWKTVNVTGGTSVFENNGITITATNNDAYTNYTANEFPVNARIPVSEGDVITLAWEESTNTAGSVYIFPNATATGVVSTSNANHKSLSYTAGAGITFITFRFGVATSGNTISYKNIQVVKGTTVPAWAPYSNICPISGWTGVNVQRTGKNLFDAKFGMKVPSITNGQMVNVSGWSTEYIKVDNSKTYRVLVGNNSTSYLLYYDSNLAFIGSIQFSVSIRVDMESYFSRASYIKLRTDATENNDPHIQLELGSIATPYHPYTGNLYPITFPTEAGTVYGGTLDVTTGELVVDRAIVDLGTLTWTYSNTYSGENRAVFYATLTGAKSFDNLQLSGCTAEKYKPLSVNDVLTTTNSIGIGTNNRMWTSTNSQNTQPSGNAVYELATSITYQLTPTEINSLLGTNNVWADAGDITTEYRADTKLYITKQITEAVNALS